ncbi:hypothetical protein BA1DRAFT_00369 [Photorhabdus aegyptia]|uniref:Uncharacterized protein n=1 Tax=Photorhabdus aegyptia TaxID=2805098 RepID=A0A022PRY7_9GAMM|nr:hypothetical protein BA1DRAFT_00369 [Photorhabdus aegyptia]
MLVKISFSAEGVESAVNGVQERQYTVDILAVDIRKLIAVFGITLSQIHYLKRFLDPSFQAKLTLADPTPSKLIFN